jgi:hypothetical protein
MFYHEARDFRDEAPPSEREASKPAIWPPARPVRTRIVDPSAALRFASSPLFCCFDVMTRLGSA